MSSQQRPPRLHPHFPVSNSIHLNLEHITDAVKLRFIAPLPVRVKRDRAWVKVDGTLKYAIFGRKRKASFDAYDAFEVSYKRRYLENCVYDRVEALMSIRPIIKPTSVLIKSEATEEVKPISANVQKIPALIKSEVLETKFVNNLVSTIHPTTSISQTFTQGHRFIQCRVTGYKRLRQKMDDFESMWDAKDEQRWNAWCEKDADERGPMKDYEDGDSDCEWEEFKAKRR
ncbi:hypothetical protein ONS95_000681 [Cadophora gregata]|uniref:uncharacterized protein n=1 Tax=Cadophora gregata TaxID=51156 RepID=UPI0026DA7D93|nr:uncharacterized protein ONS95_000681 [Cadophora gregata]KAK0128727.1 hypothetical protein ONS95_000681 [Cadophora gregata]